MTFRVNAFPDMTRSDAAAALFDTWEAGTRERQRATVDAITTVWESRAWPARTCCPIAYSPASTGSPC